MNLGKILKDKKKRDSALLGFMILMVLVFVLYLFLPGGFGGGGAVFEKLLKSSGEPTAMEHPVVEPSKAGDERKMGGANRHANPSIPSEGAANDAMAGKIESLAIVNEKMNHLLAEIYLNQKAAGMTFADIPVQELRALLAQLDDRQVDRIAMFNFFDLSSISSGEFPSEYTYIGPLRFNIFLCVFLVKIREENVSARLAELNAGELAPLMEMGCYRLLNGEATENHQLLPVFFYFRTLVQWMPVYPVSDPVESFRAKISSLRDLTPEKQLTVLRQSLRFSSTVGRFRLVWRESDGIAGNDSREYGNLNFQVCYFLGQYYLVFPDRGDPSNNIWMKDLAGADPGDIELDALDIASEDVTNPLRLRRILYNPMESRLVAILREMDSALIPGDFFVGKVLEQRVSQWRENYFSVDFAELSGEKGEQKVFKKNLELLGNHIKKVSKLLQGN